MTTENPDLDELHSLPDDAVVNVREAAAFCRLSYKTLDAYRSNARMKHRSPKFVRTQTRAIRYRVGDLRAFLGLPLKGEG